MARRYRSANPPLRVPQPSRTPFQDRALLLIDATAALVTRRWKRWLAYALALYAVLLVLSCINGVRLSREECSEHGGKFERHGITWSCMERGQH